MDFDFTTLLTLFSCATFRMYSLTLAGSLVLKTLAPQASAFLVNCSESCSRLEAAYDFRSAILPRNSSKSIPSYALARFTLYASENLPSAPVRLALLTALLMDSLNSFPISFLLPAHRQTR